jgi:hypothetical protein
VAPRTSWRSLVAWTAIVPTLVMLPLLGMPARADKRFHLYRFGGGYLERPWAVVGDQIRRIPDFLDLGNFRPLGRMVEQTQNLIVFAVADALRLPVHVPMRALGFVAIGAVAVLTLLLAAALLNDGPLGVSPPAPTLAVVPLGVAVVLVAAGSRSTVVLYTDLYFTAAALTLVAALWAARVQHLRSTSVTAVSVAAAAGGGLVLASFNELTYLGPPVAIAAVAARGLLTMRLPWRVWLRTGAVKLLAIGSLAFAVVFVPVRLEIARRCGDGSCYDASDIDVSGMTVGLLGHRSLSWWPPSTWRVAVTEDVTGHWYLSRNPVLVLAAVALVLAGIWAFRRLGAQPDGTLAGAGAVAGVGVVLLILPALLATSSAGNQELWRAGWEAGAGWRDTTYYVPGVALLATAATLAATVALRAASPLARRFVAAVLTGLLVLGSLGALGANKTFGNRDGDRIESGVHARIALAMVHFERTPAGNRYRCGLIDEFEAIRRVDERDVRQLTQGLDTAAGVRYGVSFCEGDR